MINALDGVVDDDMVAHTYGRAGHWEVLSVASQTNQRMVIGKMPKLGDFPAQRIDCTLSKEQSEKLVEAMEILWIQFGLRM